MKQPNEIKMMAHKQLFIYTLIFVCAFRIFFLIPVFFSDSPIPFLVFGELSCLAFFLVFYGIYHRAFYTIKMDENKISAGKTKIRWEDVDLVELKEVKIKRGRRGVLLGFSHRYIVLNSYIHIYNSKGEKIQLAINKKSYSALEMYAKDKSPKIKELLDKTSV